MRKSFMAASIALLGLFWTLSRAESKFPERIERALSSNVAVSEEAIAELRREGRPALDRLLQLRGQLAADEKAPAADGESPAADSRDPRPARLARLDAVIDRVGGQRYCTASRLFWHTDLEAAMQEAQAIGKPILSLRMLGKLTDEYSCANSRFFRTTLYANEEISAILRDRFVLHWRSVRPVPVVIVDFGDGRKLKRTLTGNSIHYVLTPDGQAVDALPGLYGPQAFLAWLDDADKLAADCALLDAESRAEVLIAHHQTRLDRIAHNWQGDLNQIGVVHDSQSSPSADLPAAPLEADLPTAEAATALAQPKRRVEAPLLRRVSSNSAVASEMLAGLERATDEGVWERIAALHAGEAKLDEASRRLIRSENPSAAKAGEISYSKYVVEDPLIRMMAEFQSSIALDTVRNEYLLHRRIHQWFAESAVPQDVEALNERVYAELFLTPSSDPWLGLVTPGVYSALENDGVEIADAG